MSGECEKCHEHALDCKCTTILDLGGESIKILTYPYRPSIEATINKEYFRNKFEKIFYLWKDRLWIGMTIEDQKNLLDDLIKEMEDEK